MLTTGAIVCAIVCGIGMGSETMGVVSVGRPNVALGVGVVGELRFIVILAPQHSEYLTWLMIERIRLPIPAMIAVMTMGSLIY